MSAIRTLYRFVPVSSKLVSFLPRRQILSQQQVPYTLVIFVYRHVVAVKICTVNKEQVRNSIVQNIAQLIYTTKSYMFPIFATDV